MGICKALERWLVHSKDSKSVDSIKVKTDCYPESNELPTLFRRRVGQNNVPVSNISYPGGGMEG